MGPEHAADVLIVSLGSTEGLRRADAELQDSMRRAGARVVSVPGCTQRSRMRKTMTNLDDIIRDMDKRKVDTYALSKTNPLMYWAPPGFGLELADRKSTR